MRLSAAYVWWRLATLIALLRPARATEADVARIDFPSQTRFIGLRLTDALRDRLRRTWLKLRRAED